MSNDLRKYLTSYEAKKELKIHDCELAHIRNFNKLLFIKKGNSYLYLKDSIDEFNKKVNRINK